MLEALIKKAKASSAELRGPPWPPEAQTAALLSANSTQAIASGPLAPNFATVVTQALLRGDIRPSALAQGELGGGDLAREALLAWALSDAPDDSWKAAGQQRLREALSSAASSSAQLPAEALQLLLAPARRAVAAAGSHQNAPAPLRLLETEENSDAGDSSSGGGGSGGGGAAGGGRRRLEARVRALLTRGATGAADALPDGVRDAQQQQQQQRRAPGAMASDPGGGGPRWLARAMQELGYSCTASEGAFKALLKQFPGRLDEAAVAEALGLMARTVRGLEPDGLGLASTLAAVLSDGPPAAPLGEAGSGAWNVAVAVDVIKARAPGLAWRHVAEGLDHEGFLVPEPAGLGILTAAFRRATGESIPVPALVGRAWANGGGQLSLLAAATVAPPGAVAWEAGPRRIAPLEGLAGGGPPGGTPNGCWLSADLLGVLCQLADAGLAGPVRSLLEGGPIKACREVLLVSLGSLRPPGDAAWGPLERALWGGLLPPYLAGHANSGPVLRRLWEANPAALMRGMALWAGGDAARAARAADIAAQMGVLPAALAAAPLDLAIDMAALAAARWPELLGGSLDGWLAERLARHGPGLARQVAAFIEARAAAAPVPPAGLPPDPSRAPPPQLARETAAALLRGLRAYAAAGGAGDAAGDAARAAAAAAASYPGIEAALQAPAAVPAGGGGGGEAFAPDVENEANTHFHSIYSENRPVEEVVDQMCRFKASGSARQAEVFRCMVHNLLDEFRFFPNYPEKELSVTAALFGRLVKADLFSGADLAVAVRCLLAALAEPSDSKLFGFGIGALQQLRGDLARWPALVVGLSPHAARVRAADAALGEELERAAAALQQQAAAAAAEGDAGGAPAANGAADGGAPPGEPPGARGSGAAASAGGAPKPPAGRKAAADADAAAAAAVAAAGDSVGGSGTGEALSKLLQSSVAQAAALSTLNEKPVAVSLAMTMNNETLESAERKLRDFKAPPDSSQDKVSFIMNNLSKNNLAVKAKDLTSLVVSPGYTEWFANYLTVKRAAQEPNHHLLYMELLEAMADKPLSKAVLRTTYYYATALLESDRAITQTNERTLIKQLGTWLGLQTFARNRPVLIVDMDLKAMIRDAYQRGRMIAVLPFVQKVLEGCKGSRVFRATNPMVAGILALLAEIHGMERLKLNISFVIEMTFKTFDVRLEDVLPSRALRDLPRQAMHNPDFSALPDAGKLAAGGAGAPLVAPGGPPPSLVPPAGMAGMPPGGQPPAPPPGAGPDASPAKGGAAGGPPATPPGGAPPGAAAASPGGLASMAAADPNLFAKLPSYVVINPSLAGIAERLQLKRLVPVAVDRAIVEIMPPVVERSVTIACMTAYELVTKDYSSDPDESRLRGAAHLMVSSLAGSLALVTCKEPLRVSLANQLHALLQGQMDAQMLEGALQVLVNDNLELGCSIIERAATDKAVRDIDKSLAPAYEARASARARGQPFFDRAAYGGPGAGRFPGALPESLRPKPGLPQQQRVYEDFARMPRALPPHPLGAGFRPDGAPPASPLQPPMDGSGMPVPDKPLDGSAPGGQQQGAPGGPLQGAALSDGYAKWQLAADAACARDPNAGAESSAELAALLQLMRDLIGGSEEAALLVGRRLVKHLWDAPGKAHASLHVDALALCADALGGGASIAASGAPNGANASPGARRLAGELTQLWVALATEAKFNRDVGERLLARGLLVLPEVDAYLARVLAGQRPASAVDFGVLLVRAVKDGLAGASDAAATLDVLGKLAGSAAGGEQLLQLLSAARAASRARAAERAELPAIGGLRDKAGDPPGLHQQVAGLFEEFARRCVQSPDEKLHAAFVAQLRAAGLLNMDEATDRMMRVLVELAVAHCLASEAPAARPDGAPAPGPLSFLALDPLVKLAACLTLGHGGGEQFLSGFLRMVVALVRRDAEDRGAAFNARPYLRLLAGLASEVGAGDAADPASLRLSRLVAEALLLLAPPRVPGFAFAYLELLSHRALLPRLLGAPPAAAGPLALGDLYESLLLGLLGFLEPALRGAELTDPLRALYKGTLRLLLVLLHDFPEFLCDHHFRLCDVIPPPAIQMRNLILSAFPRNMRLPDPFTPNLKFDKLPEIAAPPQGAPPRDLLLPPPLRARVDALLARRGGALAGTGALAALVATLAPGLAAQKAAAAAAAAAGDANAAVAPPPATTGPRYAGSLLHALVLYVGGAHAPGAPVERDDPGLALLAGLAGELDAEGRYLLLNAVANQLRYPNSHTYYFSCVLLTLFADAPAGPAGEALQAQVTRVLLERLIVNRPHPWGLLITFIELIKNERFNFWSHPFTKAAPELEKLFESVARSCMAAPPAAKPPGEGAAAAGAAGGAGAAGAAAGAPQAAGS